MTGVVLVLYTTRYRTGGSEFARAAATLAREKEAAGNRVVLRAVERKQAFLDAFAELGAAGEQVRELHFVGHSGVYGIMFGTTDWPEQFSPHEWRQMRLPLTADAELWFHACRTGRWFAQFVANTLGVPTHGHHWYTTVSRSPTRFVPELPWIPAENVYIVALPGRKSHGLAGAAWKYGTLPRVSPMKRFTPTQVGAEASYDGVAELYDRTFDDVRVRSDEWAWLQSQRDAWASKELLDIGCGNGAWLQRLAPELRRGVGVDASEAMLNKARARNAGDAKLSFTAIQGPELPFPDASFDVVMSMLSWRYLDWDPLLAEILRVLRPGGELLVVDMVAAPVKRAELPRFGRDKLRELKQRGAQRTYRTALQTMVRDPRWQTMLHYNPIRAEHELRWYFESRFPGRRVDTLNLGWSARMYAFRSGPIHAQSLPPMSYP